MSVNRRRLDEFSVGVTVLAAIIILIGGIIWGKGISFNSKHEIYEVQFPEVYGLKEGSSVLIQGVAHGKVGMITLNSEGARVQILIDTDVDLYDDAKVILFTPQLMGGRMVTIDPGEGPAKLKPGALLKGEVPAGMGEVMAASGEVLDELLSMIQQLNTTARRVDSIFVKSDMVYRVDRTLTDLTDMTSAMKRDLAMTTSSLRDGAAQIRNSSEEFNTLLVDNRPRIDSLMVRLNSIATEADNFSSSLETFGNQLTSQEGSLGKLMYSDSLHDELVRTIADTDSLIKRLKKEGIKVSLF
ncbi:MCE family protein [bacterium]|nr:MCE family protein [bacterium]